MTFDWTIANAASALRSGKTTSRTLTENCLQHITSIDGHLQAFVTVTKDRALADADQADAEIAVGAIKGPMHGIPIALKDLVMTKGILTTAGSPVLQDFYPDADATVASILAQAGSVLLGKTNTHEFAWGTFTLPTRNPWDLERIAGGSSGGSAAAVAAGETIAAIGTDTGGSIRIPSACCGVTGFKPTYGAVDAGGIIELASSLDHVGPIARTAEDCAILMDVLAPRPQQETYAQIIHQPLKQIQFSLLGGAWEDGVDDQILTAIHEAVDVIAPNALLDLTYSRQDIARIFADYRTIQAPEALRYHQKMGWFPQRKDLYTEATRDRLEHAEKIPPEAYLAAVEHREVFQKTWLETMDRGKVDLYLAPTMPIPAPLIRNIEDQAMVSEIREAMLRLTFPINILGYPAITIPCGFTEYGLPIGLQIIGRPHSDALILQVAHAYQQQTDWHMRRPPLM